MGSLLYEKPLRMHEKMAAEIRFSPKKSPLIGFSQDYSTYHSYQLGYSELNKNGLKVHCKSFFFMSKACNTQLVEISSEIMKNSY